MAHRLAGMEQDWRVGFFVMGKPLYKVVRAATAEEAKWIIAMQVFDTLHFCSAEPHTAPAPSGEDVMEKLFPGFKFKK